MRAEYERIRTELQKVKDKGGSEASTKEKSLMNQLKKQNKSLIKGSLGLENLFREIGQIFEAVKYTKYRQHTVYCYPGIVVDILNQGYPVELMDGDASHVPMVWISAVLDHLKLFHKRRNCLLFQSLEFRAQENQHCLILCLDSSSMSVQEDAQEVLSCSFYQ